MESRCCRYSRSWYWLLEKPPPQRHFMTWFAMTLRSYNPQKGNVPWCAHAEIRQIRDRSIRFLCWMCRLSFWDCNDGWMLRCYCRSDCITSFVKYARGIISCLVHVLDKRVPKFYSQSHLSISSSTAVCWNRMQVCLWLPCLTGCAYFF